MCSARSLGATPPANSVIKTFSLLGIRKSNIDHVAMVLKFESESKEVFFLEATGNNVCIL